MSSIIDVGFLFLSDMSRFLNLNLNLNLILLLISTSFAFAQETHTLETIVVAPYKSPASATTLKKTYSVQTITAEEIKQNQLNSASDLLNFVSGADLRYRSGFGIQGDLSLRGSTYEQVAILIDGIKLIDPQTGHHNLDIPLTVFDVEKVEVIKEGTSSLYGAGAFAGSVNIITKKPSRKVFNLETTFGEHALFTQAASLSLPQENFFSRLSFDHKISSGARPNTDFEYGIGTIYLNKDWDSLSQDFLFGYQRKDFGADSFYSNLFPEEEEHTETFLLKTSLDVKLDSTHWKNNLFLRKHRDKFILRRNNPTSVNYHTTYIYGLDSAFALPTDFGDFLFGLDIGRDEIYSSNLGKHTRLHNAGLIGFIPRLSTKLSVDFRLRFDHYQHWPGNESFNLGLGYQLIGEKLRIRGSLGRAFRIPSFTELYYFDAANQGNDNLKIEKSDNYQVGLEFQEKTLALSLDGFFRRGDNLIDWTRLTTADPWQATNLGRVDFKGVEFSSQWQSQLHYKGLKLDKITFSYTYIETEKKNSGFLSKYALDILKQQLLLGVNSGFYGLNINWHLSYQQRYYGETYFLANMYISKKMENKNFIFEPFLSIDNLSNTEYREVSGVLQPGRWVKAGLKFSW